MERAAAARCAAFTAAEAARANESCATAVAVEKERLEAEVAVWKADFEAKVRQDDIKLKKRRVLCTLQYRANIFSDFFLKA